MGYTHYWYRPPVIPAEIFGAIRLDFERLILPLADYGVHLAAGLGEDLPIITNDHICLNGVKHCGHPKNDEIGIPYPTPDACGIGPSASAVHEGSDGLITRIKHRCCNGSCDYETYHFPRSLELEYAQGPNEQGLFIGFTKTAFRPYDIAVTAALLIAKRHLKDRFMVHTEGGDCQWSDAKHICQNVLGYGEWFGIVEEQIEEKLPDESSSERVSVPTLIEIHPPALA